MATAFAAVSFFTLAYALFIYLCLVVVCAIGAEARGKNGGAWFFVALIFSPLVAGFALLLLLPGRGGRRSCPYCSELVLRTARVCPYCRLKIEGVASQSSVSAPLPARLKWQMALVLVAIGAFAVILRFLQ